MSLRVSPVWWPLMLAASPALVPWLAIKHHRYQQNCIRASRENVQRIDQAALIELPELEWLSITVLVEWQAKPRFLGDAGVSYLLRSDQGTMLFDVGFGASRPALLHNAQELGLDPNAIEALAISHLHGDHMGGMLAQKQRVVKPPQTFCTDDQKPCYLPDQAEVLGFSPVQVTGPQLLSAGVATAGPLACSLFVFGYTLEQAIVANIKGRGLVVLTGCGHPGIGTILQMTRAISELPVYAIGGGMHLPIAAGRGNRMGIQFQRILGTGKPPWQKTDEADLTRAVDAINSAKPELLLLSAHDTCDYSLAKLHERVTAKTVTLAAGETHILRAL